MSAQEEISLTSGRTELTVSARIGKITRLMTDGKNLLVEPHTAEHQRALTPDERSSFTNLDAWGADECYPSIGASGLWNLRDHGDLWAQTPTFFFSQNNTCSTGWQKNNITFKRAIHAIPLKTTTTLSSTLASQHILGAFLFDVNFPSQCAVFCADGTPKRGLEVLALYASHVLFAAEPGDRLEWSILPGQTNLQAALEKPATRKVLSAQNFAPDHTPIASKFFVQTGTSEIFVTSLVRQRMRLRIDVLQDASLPWVGIWWCHNGWGDGRPHSTIGIEPTNQPSDGPLMTLGNADRATHLKAHFSWVISEI